MIACRGGGDIQNSTVLGGTCMQGEQQQQHQQQHSSSSSVLVRQSGAPASWGQPQVGRRQPCRPAASTELGGAAGSPAHHSFYCVQQLHHLILELRLRGAEARQQMGRGLGQRPSSSWAGAGLGPGEKQALCCRCRCQGSPSQDSVAQHGHEGAGAKCAAAPTHKVVVTVQRPDTRIDDQDIRPGTLPAPKRGDVLSERAAEPPRHPALLNSAAGWPRELPLSLPPTIPAAGLLSLAAGRSCVCAARCCLAGSGI